MPFYEFQCFKGHITERLCKIGTKRVMCDNDECRADQNGVPLAFPGYAQRILSATPTTFVSAGGRKL